MPIETFDDQTLRGLFDDGSFARGRAYADERRVTLLETKPDSLKAVCLGSGTSAYLVRVRWTEDPSLRLRDECSCPIGGRCKHVVAVVLTARRQAQPDVPGDAQVRADWRRLLGDLPGPGQPDAPAHLALALQVAVRHPRPSRWAATTGPTVGIRPMRRSHTGRWVKTGASWRDLSTSYGYGAIDLDPAHRSAIRSLASSGNASLSYVADGPVDLALFDAGVWHQLRLAVEAGVALIGERSDDVVELSGEVATPEIDLTAAPNGDVTVRTAFRVGDELVDPRGLDGGLIGTPPHGLWLQDGTRLRLVPMRSPLHHSIARLADAGPMAIPAADVDEFLDRYQPALARHATTGSSDGSVTIEANRFDGLVLVVRRDALDEAELAWHCRYRRGPRATLLPLRRWGGQGRDVAAERAAVAALDLPVDRLPGLATHDGWPLDPVLVGWDAIVLLTEVLPHLDAQPGVEVEVRSELPTLRAATEAPQISLRVTDAPARPDGNDWFDLAVEVTVDGEVVDFASLFSALVLGQEALVLPSGTWIHLDRPDFDKLRELIEEARGLAEPEGDAAATVNRFQGSWFDELAELGVVAAQSRRWEASVAELAALTAPEPVPAPAALRAELRHYQQEGLDWLAFLHRNHLGGILADDMGLGKTVQTIALCLHIVEAKPDARFLVVAPTSVVENWAREIARFAPSLRTVTIHETQNRRGTTLASATAGASVVITSYALLRLEEAQYAAQAWELLLLDEAQFVKNHQSKTYQAVRKVEAATKVAMTGTPLENSLMDLWSLLSITAPGLYPDPKRFGLTYRKPIESGESPELLATFRRRIAPFVRRRTKDAVLSELPPKTEQTVEIELSARHARIYETQLQAQRKKVLGLVGNVQKHRFEILRSLTLLRQLALDPGLVDDEHAHVGSAKLDRLIDDLTQIVAEGHRALVFSQFTRFLAKVRERLDDAGIEHAYLDGRTRKRDEAIARFREGGAPVFVISLKAGGFGLNLTEADYCFVLDPWWNPAAETQAVDRAHRIGQDNPVMVYRYVSAGTIEEKVMDLKARKADLFARVVDAEGALSGALSEDDIRGLLDLG
ncbi:MAG: DEAD/DEAH box helicase [Acidimicrobiales bacterium]